MSTRHKVALAAALGSTALVGSAAAVSAGSAVVTPPPGATPTDLTPHVDSTGILTVSAPAAWTEVRDTPLDLMSMEAPMIIVSSDIAAFDASGVEGAPLTTPGVSVALVPVGGDPEGWLRDSAFGDCADEVVEPFDNGSLHGLVRHRTSCAPGTSEVHTIAASSERFPDGLVVADIMVTAESAPGTVDAVLASVALVGDGAASNVDPAVPTVPAVPSVPTVPAGPGVTIPTGPAPTVATAPAPSAPAHPVLPPPGVNLPVAPESIELVDGTGRITVRVPATWTSQALEPLTGADGSANPVVIASTDLAAFVPPAGTPDTYGVPGLIYRAHPFSPTPAATYSDGVDGCTAAGVEAYDDGLFTGELHHYVGCAGTATRVFVLYANPSDNSFTATLFIQITSPDNADLNTILGSFNYTGQ